MTPTFLITSKLGSVLRVIDGSQMCAIHMGEFVHGLSFCLLTWLPRLQSVDTLGPCLRAQGNKLMGSAQGWKTQLQREPLC